MSQALILSYAYGSKFRNPEGFVFSSLVASRYDAFARVQWTEDAGATEERYIVETYAADGRVFRGPSDHVCQAIDSTGYPGTVAFVWRRSVGESSGKFRILPRASSVATLPNEPLVFVGAVPSTSPNNYLHVYGETGFVTPAGPPGLPIDTRGVSMVMDILAERIIFPLTAPTILATPRIQYNPPGIADEVNDQTTAVVADFPTTWTITEDPMGSPTVHMRDIPPLQINATSRVPGALNTGSIFPTLTLSTLTDYRLQATFTGTVDGTAYSFTADTTVQTPNAGQDWFLASTTPDFIAL